MSVKILRCLTPQMTILHLRKFYALDEPSQSLLKNAMERFGLSARSYDRILKVGRTIADLDGWDARQYRNLDRIVWRR